MSDSKTRDRWAGLVYGTLVDRIRHHHDRLQHHTTTFMAIHSALAGFLIMFLAGHRVEPSKKYLVTIALAVLGLYLARQWRGLVGRIKMDSDLAYFQLRRIEDEFFAASEGEAKSEPNSLKVITEGYEFFHSREPKTLRMESRPQDVLSWARTPSYAKTGTVDRLLSIPRAYSFLYYALILLSGIPLVSMVLHAMSKLAFGQVRFPS